MTRWYMEARQQGTHRKFRRLYRVRDGRYVWSGTYGNLLRKVGRASGVLNGEAQRQDFVRWCHRKALQPRTRLVEQYPWVSGDREGLNPQLLAALNLVGRDLVRIVYIRSGLRTREEQERLYAAYLAGNGPLAAKPGTSRHESGNAADCQLRDRSGPNIGNVAQARTLMRQYGLCLPVPGETWHVETGNLWRA